MADTPCGGCGKPMGYGEYTEFDGKEYHVECFKCELCSNPFGDDGKYFEYKGKPCHQECIDKAEKGTPPQAPDDISDEWGDINEETTAPPASGANNNHDNREDEKICGCCRREIQTGGMKLTSSTGDALYFHEECFKCKACGKNLQDARFSIEDGLPIHLKEDECKSKQPLRPSIKEEPKDEPKEAAGEWENEPCAKCGQPIKGQRKTVPDFGHFHLTCFRCSICGMGIRLEQKCFKSPDGKPVCHRCIS